MKFIDAVKRGFERYPELRPGVGTLWAIPSTAISEEESSGGAFACALGLAYLGVCEDENFYALVEDMNNSEKVERYYTKLSRSMVLKPGDVFRWNDGWITDFIQAYGRKPTKNEFLRELSKQMFADSDIVCDGRG